jgi:hypothetical protein
MTLKKRWFDITTFYCCVQVCSERSAGAAEAICAGEPCAGAGAGRTGLRSLLPHPSR